MRTAAGPTSTPRPGSAPRLGPVIVEAKVADDLLIGRSLVLAPATVSSERVALSCHRGAVTTIDHDLAAAVAFTAARPSP